MNTHTSQARFDTLISKYLDETLTDEEACVLNGLLESDPDKMHRFFAHIDTHVDLYEEANIYVSGSDAWPTDNPYEAMAFHLYAPTPGYRKPLTLELDPGDEPSSFTQQGDRSLWTRTRPSRRRAPSHST